MISLKMAAGLFNVRSGTTTLVNNDLCCVPPLKYVSTSAFNNANNLHLTNKPSL